jgi:prophage regulatory protein
MEHTTRRFLRIKQVSEKVGLSKATLYERLNKKSKWYGPAFPVGIRLGSGSSSPVVWLESDIDAWMDAQIEKAMRCANGH